MSRRSYSALVFVATIAWLLELAAGTPWVIVLGAFVPAALYVSLIWILQRRSGRAPADLGLAFLWGAAGASFISTTLNVAGREWIGTVAGSNHARVLTATVLAPGIEEVAKALGIVLLVAVRPVAIRSVRDGIVYGALIGIGFVCTENVLYLGYAALRGGEAALVRTVYMRGLLFGATHAVFTACVGAGIGWARALCRDRSRLRLVFVPLLGFVIAVSQHIAWNTAASELINGALCGASVVGGTCRDVPSVEALFGWAPLWSVVFLAPGCAALWVVACRRAPQCG